MLTKDLLDIYSAYELDVHGKERGEDFLVGHLCNSPMFDPENIDDMLMAEEPAARKGTDIDKLADRKFKDEGVLPGNRGKGAFHMYHKIDDKVVAIGVIDMTRKLLNSEYFIFDPKFKHLSLGVVGAIHELQYMKKLRQGLNKDMQYYQLGELVIDAPKVNYKMNYKPGLVICPRTNKMMSIDEAMPKIREYTRMPLAYKKEKYKDTGLYLYDHQGQTQFEK